MEQAELPGDPPITITLRRSAAARRLSLRVSKLDGKVTMSLPKRVPAHEALDFARSKEDWLRRMLGSCLSVKLPQIGGVFPVEGRELPIVAARVRGVRLHEDTLMVPDDPARLAARLAGFLKVLARDRLIAATDHYAAAIGRGYAGITLRDTRSRWGSCAPDGRLMYSWRLVMAPPQVLDYVAAHEVAHLVEMNHSPDYWRVVASICPDYRSPRDWLKRHGTSLHRWQLSD